MRLLACMVGLVVATAALAGCAAAPAPAPSPEDTYEAPTEPSWDADNIVTREFPDADGTLVECTRFGRITPARPTAPDELVTLTAAAQEYYAASDWSTVEVSLDFVAAEELETRRAQGVSEPELYMMALGKMIASDLVDSGYLQVGMGLETFVTCE